ncbi:hypothetical protein LWI28_019265 [Acer negundo]|uniref:Uncharacterized protein n=1 Tax=Acer negundo TaxID=4023 RepID=A0AAD5I6P3_ACENE|nr:hypothetical protein LWI28_019265 [Acer negundo]
MVEWIGEVTGSAKWRAMGWQRGWRGGYTAKARRLEGIASGLKAKWRNRPPTRNRRGDRRSGKRWWNGSAKRRDR